MKKACLRRPNVHAVLTLVNSILGISRLGKSDGSGPEPLSWREVADFRERLLSLPSLIALTANLYGHASAETLRPAMAKLERMYRPESDVPGRA